MFGRKRNKKSITRVVADERFEAQDFVRRPAYESYRAAEYSLYPKLEEDVVIPNLNTHLESLFAGTVDDANGDMLDSIIFGPAREASPELVRQRWNHTDIIRRLIARRNADREDFGRILEERRRELAELEKDYERTCCMAAWAAGEEQRI